MDKKNPTTHDGNLPCVGKCGRMFVGLRGMRARACAQHCYWRVGVCVSVCARARACVFFASQVWIYGLS
jgi:hypothetical protein